MTRHHAVHALHLALSVLSFLAIIGTYASVEKLRREQLTLDATRPRGDLHLIDGGA